MSRSRRAKILAMFTGLIVAFSMVSLDYAEARRGGSFGSRGARTHQNVPATRTAPSQAAPVKRSMTPNTAPNAARQPSAAQQRSGFMNGLGGSLLRGLLLGGLIGLLLGQGLGGLAGFLGLLLQGLLIAAVVMLALRFFRGQKTQQPAMAGAGNAPRDTGSEAHSGMGKAGGFTIPSFGSPADAPRSQPLSSGLALEQADLSRFEALLSEVQNAFAREDHDALRQLVTPEMVSYLSEELAQNAHRGLHNEVSDVKLLEADIAESWSEGARDYATAALRYEALDVMRDRATGKIVEGDADAPSQTTEIWTFVRENGGDWKLSAIQQPN
ncbi:Tim44 domain-containing protein [Mesorhizobium sp. KR1-2]|uniref:Tim44 domain-containing protein n=1 Tax=Mesorhizobium sp. KR1-2 TaxID=3156609 RepID=UPI0032B4B3BB